MRAPPLGVSGGRELTVREEAQELEPPVVFALGGRASFSLHRPLPYLHPMCHFQKRAADGQTPHCSLCLGLGEGSHVCRWGSDCSLHCLLCVSWMSGGGHLGQTSPCFCSLRCWGREESRRPWASPSSSLPGPYLRKPNQAWLSFMPCRTKEASYLCSVPHTLSQPHLGQGGTFVCPYFVDKETDKGTCPGVTG